jgi:1-deoxy-D-xylulose-5-phosphate reductoisomerase
MQTMEVVRQHPDRFRPVVLTVRTRVDLLLPQVAEFKPHTVVLEDYAAWQQAVEALKGQPVRVLYGQEGLVEAVQSPDVHTVLTALVGFAGLRPTLAAIQAGKHIALANKETLVVAGEQVMQAARRQGVDVLPVDSEHSALFQCLVGEPSERIRQLILTASGGPFRGFTAEQLQAVTREQALKHPNWSMGPKITIDSASMMNKGLEVIEARWLYDIPGDRIDIVVHPQSIIHSLVEFVDGSLKAQLGLPDMRLPIQYALTYPDRLPNTFPRFNFARYPQLTFETVDKQVFRSLAYAYDALARGGNAPCILNAANEVAVAAFLEDRIRFVDIYRVLEETLESTVYLPQPTLEDLFATDAEARQRATEAVV